MTSEAIAVVLGLTCALGWGAADFCGGLASRRASTLSALLISELSGLVLLLPLPLISGESFPGGTTLFFSSIAGVAGTFGLFFLYRALASGKMSLAAPVSGLVGASLPVAFTAAWQGLPAPLTLAGFGLAALAIWLIAASPGSPGKRGATLQALGLPFIAGIAFGLYFILIHQASQGQTFFPVLISRSASTLALLAYLWWRKERVQISGQPLRIAGLGGLLDASANIFYLLSAQAGRLDVAVVVSSLYPGSTILLAALLLKERLSGAQQLGVAAALAAIALIAL